MKNPFIKTLSVLFCLLVAGTASATDRDSLIHEYAGRLVRKLDSLIALNAKNDAAGKSWLNNYILRLGAGMYLAEDNTGFLRQPEITDANGKKVSFLGNEVNETKLQGYENELTAINAACTTHKSYMVLIGNIPVEFENTLDSTQWTSIGQFFETKGDKAQALKEEYKKKLMERQGFYNKVLERVRQQIGTPGGTPLAIYNLYSYRLTAKANGYSTLLNYMHMDSYGNFSERETFGAIRRANLKKFSWQSKFRSDFVESTIGLIKKNNEDYKNMGEFFGAGLTEKLDVLYNAILAKKTVGEADQATVLGQSELAALLTELNEAAFGRLTAEQRIKLLKILTFGNSLNNDYEHALLYVLRTTPGGDAKAMYTALKALNPLRIDGGVSVYGLYKTMEDEDDTYVVGSMQPGQDNNMLSAAMLALRELHIKLPDADKETMLTELTTKLDERFFIWDYNFSTIRLLQGLWGVGSMDYDVVFNKDGSLTVTRKEITGYKWFSLEPATRDDPFPGVYSPKFGEPKTFTINDPLGIIIFSNRSDLGIVVPVEKAVAGEDNLAKGLPAIYLAYANNKKLNKANEDKIGIVLTALNLAVPYTRLLNIIKSGSAIQKIFALTQLTSTAGSGLRLANYVAPLQNDTLFNKIITCMELSGIINLFNIKSGSNAVKNLAVAEGAEEKIGKFIAAVESDPVAYNKLIEMVKNTGGSFSAEQKAAAELILSVRTELRIKGENVFGSRFYTKYATSTLGNLTVNRQVARAFETTGLYGVEVVNGTQGTFKVTSKAGGNLLAEADGSGVVQLKENTALMDGLTETQMVKVKYKKMGSGNVEDGWLVGTKKPDGTSCLIAGYCFTAGTPVAVPGGLKNIEAIKEGDEVMTKDLTGNKNLLQKVTAITKKTTNKLVRLIVNGDTVITTPEHPFYTQARGWTFAGDLKRGIKLLTMAGTSASVTAVQAFDSTATVYNFEVPTTHNYYVGKNNLLAHNTEACTALVGKMAVKLGTGYNEMELIIKDIAARYKTLSKLSEEAAFAKLEQLCSRAVSKEQLKVLLDKVKANAALKEQFIGDIVKYGELLDDFGKNGDLLINYIAIKTDNYTNYIKLDPAAKQLFPSYTQIVNLLGDDITVTLYKTGESFNTLASARNAPGIALGEGKTIVGKWLKGTEGNAGLFPKLIADKLRSKNFNNFDDFRQAFWKEVGNEPTLAGQFSPSNVTRMKNGNAPVAFSNQWLGSQQYYVLHHKTPINRGGGVYNMDNLFIVTPRYHKEILDPAYHYGYGY